MKKDPICGMAVDEAIALSAERDGEAFYFCSEHCWQKFLGQIQPVPKDSSKSGHRGQLHHGNGEHPHHSHHGHAHATVKPPAAAKYFCPMDPDVVSDKPGSCPKRGMALELNPAWKPEKKTIYTCPMHPEIEQDHPGTCPKCGMALEPKTVSAETEADDSELRDMSQRFWIGGALTLPIFVLAMAHLVPSSSHTEWVSGEVSRWIQFILSTPVVLWAGWPFFQRGWRSLINRHLNMFTLIAMGVGAAYVFSAGVTLVKGDLRGIVRAVRLGRALMRNIWQNLFFAFIYNALGIPVAAGLLYPLVGTLLSPIIAGAAMSFSSVSVIVNALRLRHVKL